MNKEMKNRLVMEERIRNVSGYNDKSLEVSSSYKKKARLQFLERIRFFLIPTAQKRVEWLRKKKKFALLGEHVHYQPRKYPTDGARLKIHNNVAIATDVEFTMHDVIHWVFDGLEGKRSFVEYRSCIEIYDNVFIGAGSRILPNVSVGPNAIVAAGSMVNKDVPPGTIVAGVPARVIGSFDDFMEKRRAYSEDYKGLKKSDRLMRDWETFYQSRENSASDSKAEI